MMCYLPFHCLFSFQLYKPKQIFMFYRCNVLPFCLKQLTTILRVVTGMSHQACVTTYFTRKRKRDILEPSKRKKIDEEIVLSKRNAVVCDENSDAECTGVTNVKDNTKVVVTKRNKVLAKKKTRQIKEYFLSSSSKTAASPSELSKTKISAPIFDVGAKTLNFSKGNSSLDVLNLSSEQNPKSNLENQVELSHDTESSSLLEVELHDAVKSSEVAPSNSVQNIVSGTKKVSKTESFAESAHAPVLAESRRKVKVSKGTDSVAGLPQKSYGKVQDVLKSKGKLKDLQETLLKIKELKEKTNRLHAKNEAKTKVLKSGEKREYAYAKYHSLAQTIPKGLILPYKYNILKDMFLNLDTVVSMLFNRQETITWSKVNISVKEMLKKDFELNHLAQIKHIFPEAYQFRQETNIVSFVDPSERSKYQLTLHPILEKTTSTSEIHEKMTGTVLIKRRHHFHLQLLDVVKKQHQTFLSSLYPPIQAKDDGLRRWHPQFSLDMVPDIPAAQLPSPPFQDHLRCLSAKDAFEKAGNKLTQKAAKALYKVATLSQTSSSPPSDANNNSHERLPDLPSSPRLLGVSESLLKKIRQKEAEKKSRMMMRPEEDIEKLNQLQRLPDVSRALRSLFVDEKKASLPLSYISLKLSKCCPLVCTADSMDKHLRLLSEQISTWFNVTSVRGQEYGRLLNRHMPISDVLKDLNVCLKKAESV